MTPAQCHLLEPLLRRALAGWPGAVLSGGTAVGLPGLAGRLARGSGLRLIGYVPRGRGDAALYAELRETDADDFGVREALAMWSDLEAAAIAPSRVRLVACPGGAITRAEVLLARALGAQIAWIDPACDAPAALEDELPFGADGVVELPPDAMALRAFLAPVPDAPLDPALREQLGRHLHAAYRRHQLARRSPGDPALASWEELLPSLRASSLAAADDIPRKLAEVGRRLARPGERLELSAEEVERLAELEHGRYIVERLRAGWRSGGRVALRQTTPYLRPWAELDAEAQAADRDAVLSIGPALEAVGWGVAPV